MEFSPWHIFIVLAVILLFFGGRKIPEMMKGLGQGVREFKEGMRGEPTPPAQTSQPQNPPATNAPASTPTPTEQK